MRQIFETDDCTLYDLQPDLLFEDPNQCADFILREKRKPLSPALGKCDWVVCILGGSGLFFPAHKRDAEDEGYDYFEITFDNEGLRILKGER